MPVVVGDVNPSLVCQVPSLVQMGFIICAEFSMKPKGKLIIIIYIGILLTLLKRKGISYQPLNESKHQW